ncbi:unnamed protein product [Penicillium glandicola]
MSLPLQLPETFAQIPRYKILYSNPSPIHLLPSIGPPRVSPHHPLISIYAKREDHSSPLACAGNKYRKLEYIVPDILSQTPLYHSHENNPTPPGPLQGPATTLVTEGAIQSNHTVQVVALARKLGLKAVILLHRGTGGGLAAASDKEAFQRGGNVQINHLLGAEVRICEEGDPLAQDATPLLDELKASGQNPYWIPGGASLHPLGGLGYARAAFEIAAQEREVGLGGSGRFDYIFVACGSGSTVGGLVAGFKLLEKIRSDVSKTIGGPRKVIGILNSPTKPQDYHEQRVLAFARRAGELIGLDGERDIRVEDVRLDDRFVGTAYGVLDDESQKALETMARTEGMVLDPVYTAKVARGMMHWAKEEVADSTPLDQVNVLFIHTAFTMASGAKTCFATSSPYEEQIGYYRAVRHGNHIFVSGTTAVDPDSPANAPQIMYPGDAKQQTRVALEESIRAVKGLGGQGAENIVRVKMFVSRHEDCEAVGLGFREILGKHNRGEGGVIGAAATMIVVNGGFINKEMLVEVEVDAIVDTN